MKIKAAVLEKTNHPLVIHSDIEIPTLKPGQLLCKISYAGLCHSQLMEARGKRGEDKYLPHMLGHEGVGEVVETGASVRKVKVGDKVVLGWIKGQGADAGGSQYTQGNRIINAGAVTTFSNYAVVSENRVVKVPSGCDDKLAVLLGCALPTGAGISLNELKPEAGANVGVMGMGGIGLSALLALHHFRPANIVAFDMEPEKLALAAELGAHRTYLSNQEGIDAFNRDFPNGMDYFVEAAGTTDTIELAFSLTAQKGLCIFASHPKHGDKIRLDPHELICGKRIQGSWGGATDPDKDLPFLVDIIGRYSLPAEKLFSKQYNLEQINEAFDDLEQRKIVRALILMPED